MLKFEKNHHWYQCRSGNPSPQHDADLRVARKKLLYPSVTTIDKDEFKNDFLDRWKLNELVVAAAQNPRMPHENDEAYCNRIYQASLEKARTAAAFGKAIHKGIESFPEPSSDPAISPWMERFEEWHRANVAGVIANEKILLDHDLGVAGCCDCIGFSKEGGVIIPDWKTQNVKKDDKGRPKPAFYDSWPRQLAFYAVSYAKEAGLFPDMIPTCISVVIDSNEPQPPFVKVWSKEEILSAYQDFVIAAYRWFKRKKYYPQPAGMFNITPSIAMPL